ncbi:hypothetical protein [Pseudoalteromonas aliena]|jgi:hypothetical protein|uniref:Uncharacterized protein n=1 Tax=Pseudoalteromonas aliena SW19 TaxID=1314866 RepID=A0ABR9DZJ2_9GAMM|nr:hypothetical protein [Pseudoalteromonas aliena]MBE0358614.1 hypothetical protein [Pseudoalteromonas aliena SW19]
MTQFHFILKKTKYLFAVVVLMAFTVWLWGDVLNPEEGANSFRQGSLLNEPTTLFWLSTATSIFFIFTCFYMLVLMESKLTLDIEKCSVSVSYYLLPQKTIYFESLNNLAVFKEEENPAEFGLYCAKQSEYYKPIYDSRGLFWTLSQQQTEEFIQLVKKHQLDQRKFPWHD